MSYYLNVDYDALKSENQMLKSNASMPCNFCITLNDDLDKVRDEIFCPCGKPAGGRSGGQRHTMSREITLLLPSSLLVRLVLGIGV